MNDTARVRRAAQIAIDRVYSEEFANEVRAFMRTNQRRLQSHSDWRGLEAEQVLSGLRSRMDRASLATYDGPIAWIKHNTPWVRNLAYDASNGHPARINRWGIGKRSDASLANTIVHEAAHAADLRHENSDKSCSPPYVLGEIVQRMAGDPRGEFISHCTWFDEPAGA